MGGALGKALGMSTSTTWAGVALTLNNVAVYENMTSTVDAGAALVLSAGYYKGTTTVTATKNINPTVTKKDSGTVIGSVTVSFSIPGKSQGYAMAAIVGCYLSNDRITVNDSNVELTRIVHESYIVVYKLVNPTPYTGTILFNASVYPNIDGVSAKLHAITIIY